MKKHTGWCDDQSVAHAWATPESNRTYHLDMEYQYRVCENCGKIERRKIIIYQVPDWEEA
jgi:hypothetical protein